MSPMMSPPTPMLLIFLTLSFCSVIQSEDAASPLRIELDQLRSRISLLETRISERVEELKRKDDCIKAMEKNIESKLGYTASLHTQIESLQRGSPEAEERKASMFAKSTEFSNQANILRKEIDAQMKKKDDLEVRIHTVEKRQEELYQKLGSLQNISDVQRTMISKIKHDIQFAEEKLLKLRTEASLASEEMNQIYGGWFPQWLAASVDHFQTYTVSLWTERGRPGFDWAIQKALDVKAIVQERAGPHIDVIKKETKQLLKPYLTQISVTSKPQFGIITRALKRHSRQISETYRRLMRSMMAHHTQVQYTIIELLKCHEYTRPFADKDIAWYLASAIFALPAIIIVNLYISLVSHKPRRRSHKHHARRRARRLRLEN